MTGFRTPVAPEARQKYTTDTGAGVGGETFRRKTEARLFTQKSMLWSEIERRAATSPVWQWHRPDALARLKANCVHRDLWREEGSYVDKGPFPKPATAVRVRELSRDDTTGMATLRLTPVHGDTLHAELGGPATSASMTVDGRRFETADLRVSFFAVDSTGEHQVGDPVEWRNRITLQSREYTGGNERRVEIHAAPPAPHPLHHRRLRPHGCRRRLRRPVRGAGRRSGGAGGGRSSTWSELNLSDDLALDAERIEAALEHLRGLVVEGEASIETRCLQFETGQRFLDYVSELRIDFRRDEVEQSS